MSDVRNSFIYRKEVNGKPCQLKQKSVDTSSPCSASELQQAEAARNYAIQIVEDLLARSAYMDLSHLEGYSGNVVQPQDSDQVEKTYLTFRRYAMISKNIAQDLLNMLRSLKFRVDAAEDCFAYTKRRDTSWTVYLCKDFWKASADFERMDSQPGTLIHEASHFLGYQDDDNTYEQMPITVHVLVDFTDLLVAKICKVTYKGEDAKISFGNANNLEYEFEIFLRHSEPYVDGRYQCCYNKNKVSICHGIGRQMVKLKRVADSIERPDLVNGVARLYSRGISGLTRVNDSPSNSLLVTLFKSFDPSLLRSAIPMLKTLVDNNPTCPSFLKEGFIKSDFRSIFISRADNNVVSLIDNMSPALKDPQLLHALLSVARVISPEYIDAYEILANTNTNQDEAVEAMWQMFKLTLPHIH